MTRTLPHPAPRARVAALLGLGFALAATAQATPVDAQNPDDVLDDARERQASFERFRQSRIPVVRDPQDGGCDQRIGRMCIWFGGENEERFPDEPEETDEARRQLIGRLLQADQRVDDAWLTGQLVHYLVEQRDFTYAIDVARECGIPEEWWCAALMGYALHVRGSFVDAEDAFRHALAIMPVEERERWIELRFILDRTGRQVFERVETADAGQLWENFWRLSDPLFMADGNDRFTDHFARLVVARNRSDAENPQGMFWEDDLEEVLIRYGRIVGWSRIHDPGRTFGGGALSVIDTRRVVGHHQPKSRGYLFPEEFLESPADVPPESWITAPREARTWYAPPYAPDFGALETQVGRFRRGDDMMVVGAYQPVLPEPVEGEDADERRASEPSALDVLERPVDAALFLMPLDGGPPASEWGTEAEGVFVVLTPPGPYVSSVEVLDRLTKSAWRARQGVRMDPMIPGLVAVSDLMILKEGAGLPARLEDAIGDVRPGVRVRNDERFTVTWEVYGLRVEEAPTVTLGFTEGRPGFLERVGEFLGIIEPEQPVEITFTGASPDQVQSAFRAVTLQLPGLEPGNYTLHLRVELPGREAVVTSRPIVVEG